MAETRTPEEIRRSIEANRVELGVAVDRLRAEVAELADWRKQINKHRKQFLIGAAVAGFVIGGGIAALGGLLPLPGGLGGIDGGLLGTLVVYGTPVATTAAAILAYRVILFWLPLIVGAIAFASLRRGLNRPDRPDLCAVPAAA